MDSEWVSFNHLDYDELLEAAQQAKESKINEHKFNWADKRGKCQTWIDALEDYVLDRFDEVPGAEG